MTEASAHFASCCWAIVFPVPKAPGMVAVPPFAIGKKKSIMRWPVSRGVLLGSLRLKPLAVRTGQVFRDQVLLTAVCLIAQPSHLVVCRQFLRRPEPWPGLVRS